MEIIMLYYLYCLKNELNLPAFPKKKEARVGKGSNVSHWNLTNPNSHKNKEINEFFGLRVKKIWEERRVVVSPLILVSFTSCRHEMCPLLWPIFGPNWRMVLLKLPLICSWNWGSWTGQSHVYKPGRHPDFWAGPGRRNWAKFIESCRSGPGRQMDLLQRPRLQVFRIVTDTPDTGSSPSGPLARQPLGRVKHRDTLLSRNRCHVAVFVDIDHRTRCLLWFIIGSKWIVPNNWRSIIIYGTSLK